MMENLTIQFVYPDYSLPEAYAEVIKSIDHAKIKPVLEGADVWVTDKLFEGNISVPVVLRMAHQELFSQTNEVVDLIGRTPRLNIVVTDVEAFTDADFESYRVFLSKINERVESFAFHFFPT
ncbi:MAG: hypothetical protein IJJ94_09380 [Bacteroidaceae bacterium]|nr:hypothetical protein [Bacteroidaceae bacterium]